MFQRLPAPAFFYSFLFFSGRLFAQCPLSVDAGPNQYTCTPGGSVELQGSIAGQDIGFRWSPATGLSSTTVLNPTVTVNGTVTYTLTAAAEDPAAPNLVVNPGFESGNTGFTSSYIYTSNPINPGTYFITTSPAVVIASFPPCDDHTYGNGTGNMMLCNGTGAASAQAWCQSVPVMPNNWYILRAWVLCSPIAPPVLQFRVNGAPVGTAYTAQPLGCVWQEFSATWFSGASVSANLCIFDINGSGNGLFGDDYALDDIYMAKACTVSDQVTVSVANVNAVLPASITLPCSALQTGIALNGSGSSSGPGITYSWDGPGILSGGNTPVATVNEPGVYTLTVSFDTGNGLCTDEASITVLPDPFTVTANAAAPAAITCNNPAVTLSGAGSSTGPAIGYSWQPAAGIVSGGSTLNNCIVNAPGIYTLTVTHTVSGCTATATATVSQNAAPATAAASAPGALPCTAGGTLTLSGAGSSTGNNFTYLWAGPGIVSGDSTLNNCVINAPGVYTLRVTNTASGCTATASATVPATGAVPLAVAVANAPGALNCVTPVLTLNSTGSSTDSTFIFLWTTINGHFTGPLNGTTATVDSAGQYILTITNPQNGCAGTDTVVVAGLYSAPGIAIAQPASAITCTVDSVQLDATASPGGPGILALWTTASGLILSGDTTLSPWAGAPGLYFLTLTDTTNGCVAIDTAEVTIDTLAPVAVATAEAPGVLNCNVSLLTLNSAGSSTDSTLTYLWTTSDGHFTGPVNGPSATVDSAGLYVLTIANPGNGCSASASVSVAAHAPVGIQLDSLADLSCFGANDGLIAISAAGGDSSYTYLWQNGGNTPALQNLAAGTYSLTVTDGEQCSVSAGFVVSQPAALGVQISTTPMSAPGSNDGTATAQTAGGTAPYGYLWSTNETTAKITGLAPGMYTVTVTDANGCTVVQTAEISFIDCDLSAAVDVIPPACAGAADGQAAATPGGGTAPFGFLWSTGGTGALESGLTAGIYTVTVTDVNGCAAVASAELTDPPALTLAVVQTVPTDCPSTPAGSATVSATGGTGAPSIVWSDGQTGATATGLPAGTYTATATDTHGCTATVTAAIEAIDQQAPVLQTSPATVSLGPSGSVTLTPANLGVSATDNCALAGIEVSPSVFDCQQLGIQQVTVTATDAAGNSSSATVPVTITDTIPPVLECPDSETRCFDYRIVAYNAPVASDNCLELGGAFTLTEGLPSGSEFPAGETTTTYTFTDAQGNVSACSFKITIQTPLSISLDSILHDIDNQQKGAVNVTVSGSQSGYVYQWTSGGQVIATMEDLSGVGMGDYSLLVTDAAGCTQTAGPFTVSNITAANEPDWSGRVFVFPNPNNGILFIQLPDELSGSALQLVLSDLTGRRVLEQEAQHQPLLTLELGSLADGLYTLQIRARGQQRAWKVVLLH